jgi:hypothetical protein
MKNVKNILAEFIVRFLYYVVVGSFAFISRLFGLDPFTGEQNSDTFWSAREQEKGERISEGGIIHHQDTKDTKKDHLR